MTRLTLRQVREAFGGKITVMGGIPSVTLLRQSMSDSAFHAFLDQFFTDLGRGDHLILGISDTTPPDAAWDRLQLIGEYVRAFGEVRPTD
jgi:hypothetical protein